MSEIPRYRKGLYPHGGWSVLLPDGVTLSAGTREDLEVRLINKLKLSAQEAEDYVDQRLCLRYPSSCEGGKATRNLGLSLSNRASAYLSSFEQRRVSKVAAAVTAERLDTCAKCPANHGLSTPGCCGSPKIIEALAVEVASKHGIKGAFGAGWCGITGANLVIAAHLSEPFISEVDAVYDHLPPSCPYRC